jgi:hypothetical protein
MSYVQVFKGRSLQGNTMKEESELFLDWFRMCNKVHYLPVIRSFMHFLLRFMI